LGIEVGIEVGIESLDEHPATVIKRRQIKV
jgi:hypothetical protein